MVKLVLYKINVKTFASGPRHYLEESSQKRGWGEGTSGKSKAESHWPLRVRGTMVSGLAFQSGKKDRTMVAGETGRCWSS